MGCFRRDQTCCTGERNRTNAERAYRVRGRGWRSPHVAGLRDPAINAARYIFRTVYQYTSAQPCSPAPVPPGRSPMHRAADHLPETRPKPPFCLPRSSIYILYECTHFRKRPRDPEALLPGSGQHRTWSSEKAYSMVASRGKNSRVRPATSHTPQTQKDLRRIAHMFSAYRDDPVMREICRFAIKCAQERWIRGG